MRATTGHSGALEHSRFKLTHYSYSEVGQVRWSLGREFGLAFFSMRAEERERLGQFLTTLERGPGS